MDNFVYESSNVFYKYILYNESVSEILSMKINTKQREYTDIVQIHYYWITFRHIISECHSDTLLLYVIQTHYYYMSF